MGRSTGLESHCGPGLTERDHSGDPGRSTTHRTRLDTVQPGVADLVGQARAPELGVVVVGIEDGADQPRRRCELGVGGSDSDQVECGECGLEDPVVDVEVGGLAPSTTSAWPRWPARRRLPQVSKSSRCEDVDRWS